MGFSLYEHGGNELQSGMCCKTFLRVDLGDWIAVMGAKTGESISDSDSTTPY